ncbi:MAG: cupin domain-containing protein [Ruminococcaceae bacterium]|nr:cupin domain-containing protein [Oscillospiraceae bacterium]
MENTSMGMLKEVALRIKSLRLDCGYSQEQMAELTGFPLEDCILYEEGSADLPFSFIHKCAELFDVEMMELLQGSAPRLTGYTVTRRGDGQLTARETGITIQSLAPMFKNRKADPYWVRYEYSEAQQSAPIEQDTHAGQEFDIVIEGSLKVKIGEHTEVLAPGDSIFYNSSTPHGMIAVGGADCVFCAVVLPEEDAELVWERGRMVNAGAVKTVDAQAAPVKEFPDYMDAFIHTEVNEKGTPTAVTFTDADKFNFAFDVVDAIAEREPDRLAMLHIDREKNERRFTFQQMKKMSARAANYFRALGVTRGERVMLVLRRNWEFWPIIVGLHKLGAIPIPATDQLVEKDFEYRFNAASVSAVVCTSFGGSAAEVEKALPRCPSVKLKVMAGGSREGWHNFDEEYDMYSSRYRRTADSPCGNDTMLMLFSSGTSGYPKAVDHSFKYPLGHYVTARFWHNVDPNGIHFTISETGWGKALWGKLYGQWMCGGATFVYDFDRFAADDIMPMFAKYGITSFCAPPTMYRFFIKEDLSKYDLSSIKYATTAGEALNPEVSTRFHEATGLTIMEAFGQTETTLTIGNFVGTMPKLGSMGRANPMYRVELMNGDGELVGNGETGEIVIYTGDGAPCGLFKGYYNAPEATQNQWHDDYYHTGDLAWRDEDGYFYYVGRADDVIKSSGYRIGPFEIESVIMELPYVLECGVCAAPDEIRGQVVKACITLTKGTEGTEELKKEIQAYVKKRTAPYKYPRIVEFRDELPKTISGKIIRNKL